LIDAYALMAWASGAKKQLGQKAAQPQKRERLLTRCQPRTQSRKAARIPVLRAAANIRSGKTHPNAGIRALAARRWRFSFRIASQPRGQAR
jgi:hypothetical protein